MLDLPQQHAVVVRLRSELQAEGTAGAVALVLAAQGHVGLRRQRRRRRDDGQRVGGGERTEQVPSLALTQLTQFRQELLCRICSRLLSCSLSSSLCSCSRLACSSAMRLRRRFLSSRQSVYSSCRLSRLCRALEGKLGTMNFQLAKI